MAENEEDYLDGLLKSMSERENAEKQAKDEEEEEIKEQVREAVEKSNTPNSKFENIYMDDPVENDGKQVSDEHVEKVLKDVMTVPRKMAAPGVDESYIVDDEPDTPKPVSSVTPEEVAKLAREKEEKEKVDESVKSSNADKALDKLIEETQKDEAAGSNLSKDDELIKDMDLSDGEKDRLVNMNLDDLLNDVNTDAGSTNESGVSAVNDLLAQINQGSDQADDEASDNIASDLAATGAVEDNKADNSSDITSAGDDVKKQLEEELKSVNKKKRKKGILSVIKDIFFESLDDETEDAADTLEKSGRAAKKEAKMAKKAAKADKNDKNKATDAEQVPAAKGKDENELLIEEVFHGKDTLDDSAAPKKGLFAKIKYRMQQFKAKQAKECEAEEQQEEIERQEKQQQVAAKKAQAAEKKQKAAEKKTAKKEAAKKAKAKKPKKEKKPKKPKVKQPPKPGDIIRFKPKSIIVFVMLIVGIVVLVQMFGYTINYSGNISLAKDYYANQEYDKAYNSLDGIKLSGDDETLYKQAKVVMYVQRQYESYENYEKMNMHTEALNALVKGVDRYQTYRSEAKELGVEDKMTEVYNLIIKAFKDKFKMSETEAISLVELSKLDFTSYYYKIEAYGEAIK
ncbi:MAG: hypothetical protein KH120_10040 [Eubacterium sp.]|nr:hypothetical protein [Eubacterium sp.]MEE0182995.1 hypothetical protein [Lachnospira sp.]